MKYLILTMILLIGCADNKVIRGKEYETYGLLNEGEVRDPCIHYSLSMGNTIWGGVLLGTVFTPIYMYGFSLWEPVEIIKDCTDKGE